MCEIIEVCAVCAWLGLPLWLELWDLVAGAKSEKCGRAE